MGYCTTINELFILIRNDTTVYGVGRSQWKMFGWIFDISTDAAASNKVSTSSNTHRKPQGGPEICVGILMSDSQRSIYIVVNPPKP